MTTSGEILLSVQRLTKYFPVAKGMTWRRGGVWLRAVDDVSFDVRRGETLGLVGESGCGKSTLASCIVRLYEPTSGAIIYRGRDISRLSRRALRPLRREIQMVFQDAFGSLNPAKRVGTLIGDPLRIHKVSAEESIQRRVSELMALVGLSPEHASRFPHEFSGGQRQRIGLARALALGPTLVVADEPVSALDASIQSQVVNLLSDLQERLGLTYLFIAHDLSVVRHVSDRIAVMYLGKLVELARAEELCAHPIHPYTEALLAAAPIPDPAATRARKHLVLVGDVPNPITPPPGCRFHPRCPYATDLCRDQEPALSDHGGGHLAACHHPLSYAPAPRPAGAGVAGGGVAGGGVAGGHAPSEAPTRRGRA